MNESHKIDFEPIGDLPEQTAEIHQLPLKPVDAPLNMGESGNDPDKLKWMKTAMQEREMRHRRLVEGIGDRFVVFSHIPHSGEVLYLSGGFEKIFGSSRKEVLGKPWYSVINWAPEDIGKGTNSIRQLMDGESQLNQLELRFMHPDGNQRTIQVSEYADTDEADNRVISGIVEDITERREIEQALRESEKRYCLAMEITQDGVWDWDITTGNVYYSPACQEILGEQIVDNDYAAWEERIHPDDRPHILSTLHAHLQGEVAAWKEEYRLCVAEDVWKWVLGCGRVVERGLDDSALRMIGTTTDISVAKQAEAEREQLLYNMEKRINAFQCMFGVNKAIRNLRNLEHALCEVVRTMPFGWYHTKHAKARVVLDGKEYVDTPFEPTEWKQTADLGWGGVSRGTIEVYYSREFPELEEGPFLEQERQLLDGIADTLNEAIEHYEAHTQLEHQATHDALTGLYNRKMLEERVAYEVQRAERYQHALSVFMLDIDHFKRINDTYGHQVGDEVLRSFASMLERSIRNTDYAARYGGEEFFIIMPVTSLRDAMELAERLRNSVTGHSILVSEGRELEIAVSIGVATYPAHAQSWQTLIEAADFAMYFAKQSGRNRVISAKSVPD